MKKLQKSVIKSKSCGRIRVINITCIGSFGKIGAGILPALRNYSVKESVHNRLEETEIHCKGGE